MSDLVRRITTEPVPVASGPRLVVTANIDHIVNLDELPEFRAAYAGAWAATADGWPVALYARLVNGDRHGRLTGADLFPAIVRRLSPTRHRLFCLASTDETAAALRTRLVREGLPARAIRIVVPPLGFEQDHDYGAKLATMIRSFGTSHLFVGLGTPKSEIWIHRHRAQLGNIYACSFGAALEFHARTKRRAPRIVQAIGLEWAWRVAREPHRLARRYFDGAPRYLALLAKDWIGARAG